MLNPVSSYLHVISLVGRCAHHPRSPTRPANLAPLRSHLPSRPHRPPTPPRRPAQFAAAPCPPCTADTPPPATSAAAARHCPPALRPCPVPPSTTHRNNPGWPAAGGAVCSADAVPAGGGAASAGTQRPAALGGAQPAARARRLSLEDHARENERIGLSMAACGACETSRSARERPSEPPTRRPNVVRTRWAWARRCR